MPSIESSSRKTVLAVCFGNLCRSPIAESLLNHYLPSNKWEVISAGTHAIGGDPPTTGSCNAIAKLTGLDISRQLSLPLTSDVLQRSDYIFVMSRRQATWSAALDPGSAPLIRLLGAFAPAPSPAYQLTNPYGGPTDAMKIPDPIGGNRKVYEACCRRLIDCTKAVVKWLDAGAPATGDPGTFADWINEQGSLT